MELDVVEDKMYGRDDERLLFSEVFCRVTLFGESEATFVEVCSLMKILLSIDPLPDT